MPRASGSNRSDAGNALAMLRGPLTVSSDILIDAVADADRKRQREAVDGMIVGVGRHDAIFGLLLVGWEQQVRGSVDL